MTANEGQLLAIVITGALLGLKVANKLFDLFWSKKVLREPTNGTYLAAIESVAQEVRNHDQTEREHHETLTQTMGGHLRDTNNILGQLAQTQASTLELIRLLASERRPR